MAAEPRLRYHLLSEGAVWYHQAGPNSHVLIDPQAAARAPAPGFVRPIELWRAARWLRPPSAAVVRYAPAPGPSSYGGPGSTRMPGATGPGAPNGRPDPHPGLDSDEPPAIGDVVNRSAVVDFVGDVTAFRLGALGALIDAVAAALDGGPPVVLAAPNADTGALWIGVVSFFAPPATCLQLSFSTQERLDDVLAQLDRDRDQTLARADRAGWADRDDPARGREEAELGWRTPVLSVVPQADVDRLKRRDDLPVVVVDPRIEATLVAIGGVEHRRTHLGQQIRVTDWSRLALDTCCEDYTVLERCLRRIDEVSQATPAAGGRRGEWWPVEAGAQAQLQQAAGPAWPLAAAVALTGDLPLALPTATRVILRDTPSTVRLSSELADTLSSLVGATVNDAEQAWTRLQAALAAVPVRGALVQAAFESYLRLVLADDSWLLRQVPPLPVAVPVDPALPLRLRASISRLIERLGSDPGHDVRRGVLLLRAIDFADRMSRLVGGPNLAALGLGRLADQAVQVLLAGDVGARVAEIAGPLDGIAVARWIVPPLSRQPSWLNHGRPVGERLPPSVIALLAGSVDAGLVVASARPEALAGEPVALEVTVASAVGRIAGDSRLRGPAVEYLLAEVAQAYPDADPAAMVAEVFDRLVDGDPWNAALLLRVVERAPAVLGADLVPVALRHLPDWMDDDLSGRLAAALLKRVEFLPRRGGDGRLRPRRAGTTDGQAQLLNLLAATGPGWLVADEGLPQRAAEILMWADRAWPAIDQQVRRLIAPRITVAAFQVALAAEPAQDRTVLRSRLGVVPIGSTWQVAVPLGAEAAMPLMGEVLRLNRYRLAGELVMASTRAMVEPPPELGELPRLPLLPVGPVLRWLVGNDPTDGLLEHLAALVDQELRIHQGPYDQAGVLAFWERALPGAQLAAARDRPQRHTPVPASGRASDSGSRPARGTGFRALLAGPRRRQLGTRERRPTSSELDLLPDPADRDLDDRDLEDQEFEDGDFDDGTLAGVLRRSRVHRDAKTARRKWWRPWAGR